MKKIYMNPEIKVVELKLTQHILSGSNPKVNGTTDNPNDLLAPESDYVEE